MLLVDRASFPSTTCSSHFFRGAGMVAMLERLGVLDRVLALGCPPLTHQLTYTNGRSDPVEGPAQDPGKLGYCLSVRREALDQILVKRAGEHRSVEFVPRTAVTDLLWERERVAGVVLRTGERIRARYVVGADGRRSLVARKVTPAEQEGAPARRALYYMYVTGFRGVDQLRPDAAEFSLLDDEIAYVFPSDAGVTCIALSVNLEVFRWVRRDAYARFLSRLHRHQGIAPRLAEAQPLGRLLGRGPEASYVRVPSGSGWALVGDAGLHQDPWSGLGIDMASIHASFLADAILESRLERAEEEEEALTTYHRRRDEHALKRFRQTVALAADLRAAS